ncbi:SDR family oxidoreductase [Litoribacter populi]|uniref:SDR family oxidoreductase n=1 Tax=Litoribacter populi TaxID=2598460 RepID=UPI00117D9744|nr:SDR family oxidoreductase [Litoribacter populi]
MKLDKKVVIVTGASSGIGEAICFKLAEEGATVVMGARREDILEQNCEKINQRGGNSCFVPTDVTFRGDLDRIVKFTLDKFGRIDVMINNAGVMPLSYFESLDHDGWDNMVDTNLKGVIYGCGAVLPAFLDQGDGHIINISSDAALKTFPGGAVYTATKAAVNVFTEGLRAELSASKGIRVTCVMPGATISEISSTIEDPKVIENREKSGMDKMRMLLPEDVAGTVLYAICASKRANVNEIIVRPTDQA